MNKNKGRRKAAGQSQEKALEACLEQAMYQWGEGFCKSPHFLNLPEAERMESESIAGFFTDMMFNYLGVTPDEWDVPSMKECCVRYFPEKISEGPGFFRCIVPVLSAFFSYIAEQQLQKNAGAMALEITLLHDQIMERASDPGNWGMAKRFVMAARSDGIDVTDPKAFGKYLEAYNRKVLKEGPASGMFHNAPYDSVIHTGKKRVRKR
jgi:hypothetical protein